MSDDWHRLRRPRSGYALAFRAKTKRPEYLDGQGVAHAGVAQCPDWFVAPYLAVWTVKSIRTPGTVGWWAVSGDVPTDYLSSDAASDARSAVAALSLRWSELAGRMSRGESHPKMEVGRSEEAQELGELLRRRADLMAEFAADDTLW
jgi:hypothetical protein